MVGRVENRDRQRCAGRFQFFLVAGPPHAVPADQQRAAGGENNIQQRPQRIRIRPRPRRRLRGALKRAFLAANVRIEG